MKAYLQTRRFFVERAAILHKEKCNIRCFFFFFCFFFCFFFLYFFFFLSPRFSQKNGDTVIVRL